MKLTVRKSDKDEYGFVESYDSYRYLESGNVKIVTSITEGGNLCKPYVLRGGSFIPLSRIHEEMGIAKYIKAKKPFYSLLKDSRLFVKMVVYFNYETGEFIEDKSSYSLYYINNNSIKMKTDRELELNLRQIMDVTDTVDSAIRNNMKIIASFKGNREEFLKARL